MLKYTEEHEWLRAEGDEFVVGITTHASEQLGDVIFVELPEEGREVEAGEEIAVIESVKAASDISAPIAGVITAVNSALVDSPADVNADPMAAWFFKIKPTDPSAADEFMDEAAYKELVG